MQQQDCAPQSSCGLQGAGLGLPGPATVPSSLFPEGHHSSCGVVGEVPALSAPSEAPSSFLRAPVPPPRSLAAQETRAARGTVERPIPTVEGNVYFLLQIAPAAAWWLNEPFQL